MRANDFITEQPVTTTNPQGVTTTVNKAANRVTTKSDMGTTVKDRSGGVRSIQTPRIGGTQFKQTFRPDATPGYQQANYKSGGIELDMKGSPETGFTKSAGYSAGGVNAKQTQRYSGQTQSDASYAMGNQKVSARQTVSKPGAKPVNQMSITKGGKTTVYNDINEAFEEIIAAEAREIDPKKMQAYMDFKKENNVDGSSVRMAVDNPDHPETKRMMTNDDFAKAVDMYKSAVKESVEESLTEALKVGDKVKVKKGSMKSPSQRHYETTVGTIVKDYGDDDFKVNFGGNDDLSIEGKLLVKTQVEESLTEEQFDEKAGEKDACYRKVKSRYKVWPSAYASGALVKCRKVGAANWGNSKKK